MQATFATIQFPWIQSEADDFVCPKGDYTLRVEQMDDRLWWYCVYLKDEVVESKTIKGKYRAIGLAEGIYLGHYLTKNKND